MVARTLRTKLWRELWLLRTQTISIAVLIICGVSLLVAAWSAYTSLRNSRDSYYQKYNFADIFSEFKKGPPDIIRKIEALPGVKIVHARVSAQGLVQVDTNSEPAVGRFLSLPNANQSPLNKIFLRKGQLPSDADQAEVVVHEGFAIAHKLTLGSKLEVLINGHKEILRVVGIGISPEFIYALSPATPLPDDLHFGIFWMTEKKLQHFMSLEDSYNSVAIKISHEKDRAQTISWIDQILTPYGSLGAYDRSRQISNMFIEDEISQQRSSAIFIPTIFLAIAAFLVHVVATRLVTLQRTQIAVLKSVGYTRWVVARHYLALMISMTFVGTLPGIALGGLLGSWMSETYQAYFRFPDLDFSVNFASAMIGLVVGILPGLLGAWMGIHKAFILAPAEAMKPPAPATFRASLWERIAFFPNLTASLKMLLRNIFFRPFRLVLVVSSLAAASGVMVAAGAWGDIVDSLLEIHFNRLMREDLSIILTRPRSSSALQELLDLPGVIAVEGYRTIPIRIRYQHHKRELALTGWLEDSSMRQRLNLNLRNIPLLEGGILLSRFFKTHWQIRQGDLVEIQVLEGKQKIFSIPVIGFTDDLIGISASVKIQNLWNLLGEEPTFNFATVRIDPQNVTRLYTKIKSYPEVSAVVLKRALFEGFNSSFGQVIRTVTNILIFASLLLALGIIYNSVRVSFSERSWELASLRVLGFSRVQVSTLLISEVATQIFLSLLPGCVLGYLLTHLSMKLIHTETFDFPVVINRDTYARAIAVVILAFLVSAWIIQKMVQRLNPAEALKSRE